MTVATQQTIFNFPSASGTTFAYQCRVLADSDLKVSVDGVEQTLGVDYSVNGVGSDTGGAVIFGTPLVSRALRIWRSTSPVRSTDYQFGGDFQSSVVNRDFDRPLFVMQDLINGSVESANALRVPAGEVLAVLPAAEVRRGLLLGFADTDSADPVSLVMADAAGATALDLSLRSTAAGTVGAGQLAFSTSLTYAAGSIGRYLGDRIKEVGTRTLTFGIGAAIALAGATDVVAIGPGAGQSVTSGFGYVLIGTNAGKSLTNVAYCTAVGAYALETYDQPLLVQAIHTAVGAYALNKVVAGAQYDTAVGGYCFQDLTTGYFDTGVGQNCFPRMTIGFSNTGVGHGVGLVMTGASNANTIIGDLSASATTLATGMALLGFQVLANNTTGNSYTVGIGYSPLAQSNSADPSVAIGKQAGYTLTTAGKAALVGTLAYTLGGGAGATVCGHEGAAQETGNGANNSWFGYRSGYTQTPGFSNVTVLGANGAATRSNQVMLGDGNVTEVRTAGFVVQKLAVTGSTPLDSNGEFAFFLVDNTHFGIKMKGSDGTVRVANGTFLAGGFVLV